MAISSVVDKSAKLLDLICASAAPLTFSQVVNGSGLPKSSTHRLLSILVEQDLVNFDSKRMNYRPGPRLITWAARALNANYLPSQAHAQMEMLLELSGSHVALSVLEGGAVRYLKTISNGEPYRLAPRVGEQSPAHVCAAGKALLAQLSDSRLSTLLSGMKLDAYTKNTRTSKQSLLKDLRQVRRSGMAVCDREEFLQVAGISAPIFGHQGEAVAAMSLWNTVERKDISELAKFGPELLSATHAISKQLGYNAEPENEVE